MGYAIRTDKYRMIEWREFSSGEVTARELYDHDTDPKETVDIAGEVDAAVVDTLTKILLKSHPRRPLTMTPAVHSNPNRGRWKAELTFENRMQADVMVYPISPQGRRGTARVISSGEELAIHGRIGGVYVVESRDGRVHQIESPSYPGRTVVIESRANDTDVH